MSDLPVNVRDPEPHIPGKFRNAHDALQFVPPHDFLPQPAMMPTQHPPGSHGKVEVMRARYDNGEHVHHPQDKADYRGIKGGFEPRKANLAPLNKSRPCYAIDWRAGFSQSEV